MQTGVTKLIVAFRNFANAPKNGTLEWRTYRWKEELSQFFNLILFLHTSQVLCVSTLLWHRRRQTDNLPYPLQHVTTDFWEGSNDSSSQLSQILRKGRYKESLTYPRKKKPHGIRSGDFGGQRSSAWSFCQASDPALGQMLTEVGEDEVMVGTNQLGQLLGWRNPTKCNSMQIFIYC